LDLELKFLIMYWVGMITWRSIVLHKVLPLSLA
jgi:hypothetical protein